MDKSELLAVPHLTAKKRELCRYIVAEYTFPIVDLTRINWVIVGGESGPGAREMRRQWVIDVRQQCRADGVAFFFKQWGGVNKKRAGRMLDGQTYDEMPAVAVNGVVGV